MGLFRRSAGKYNTSIGYGCLPTIDLKGEFYDPIKHEHLFQGGVSAALQLGTYNTRNILEIDPAKMAQNARYNMAIPQRDLAYICTSFRDNHFTTPVDATQKREISFKLLAIIANQEASGQLSPVVCKMFKEAVHVSAPQTTQAPAKAKKPGLLSRFRMAGNALFRGLQPI